MTRSTLRTLLPLSTDEWPDTLATVEADMKGAPLNVHKMIAHSPDLLAAFWNFRNYSVNGGALGNRLAELVILRTGLHLGAWYEWASHVDRAIRIGLEAELIQLVLSPEIGPEFSDSEAACLHAVDDLALHHAIRDHTLALLEPHLSRAQLVDLIAIHGMYMLLGSLILTWGLELDEDVAARIEGLADQQSFDSAASAFQTAMAARHNGPDA